MGFKRKGADKLPPKSDAFTDLGLTLPIFLIYHLGVVFLPVRNAADPVTRELSSLANHSLVLYSAFTLAIGALFVVLTLVLGHKESFQPRRFLFVALEGALYAVLMRVAASYAVGSLQLGPLPLGGLGKLVMSLGAGFYEEIAFRVVLFGAGALFLKWFFGRTFRAIAFICTWAVVAAFVFSGWHYFGALGDQQFQMQSFVFRAVCGLVLTAIYGLRGFAPAVWTHAIYDVWVMVMH